MVEGNGPKDRQKNTRQNSETRMRVRSCPKSVMEVLIHLTPLHFHMDEVAWGTQVRRLAKTFPQENGFRSTTVYLETVERLNSQEYVFERKFQCVLSTKPECSGDNMSTTTLRNIMGLKMYPRPKRGPEPVFRPGTKYSEAMGRILSIFQAEIQAIEICVRANLDRGCIGQSIAIMSGNEAAIQSLEVPAETELA